VKRFMRLFWLLRGIWRKQVKRYVRWKEIMIKEGMLLRKYWSPYR
jgi:hypothetical protein